MSKYHAKLDRRRWEWVRRRVLKRDGWRCRECGRYGNQVDHIKPLHQRGAVYDESNLQVLCKSCHAQKTRLENRGPVEPEREAWAALVRELST